MERAHRYRPQIRYVKRRRKIGEEQRSSTEDDPELCAHNDDAGAETWLPAHDLILDRLPARQRCRMRCVCKAWNAQAERDLPKEVWFVMVRPPKYGHDNWRFRAYSSCSYMKEKGERPFFRPPLPNPHHSKLFSLLGGPDCSRVAQRCKGLVREPTCVYNLFLRTAGGLMSAIVCRPGAAGCYDVIVFNCLTGCVKVLPPPLNPRKLFNGGGLMLGFLYMTLDAQDPSCYYILLTYHRGPGYFEVFESRSACWKAVCNPYVPFKSGRVLRDFVCTHSSSELRVVDADFWWLQSSRDREQYCLLAYHARHDAWSSLLVPWVLCENARDGLRLLVKFKRRLLLGLPLVGVDGAMLGFGVWELQPTSLEAGTWVEVARTPERLWPPLKSSAWSGDLFADGSLFWMMFYNRGNRRSFRPPLVFDMAQNSWYSLPLERSSRKFGCIFAHRPSFSASV